MTSFSFGHQAPPEKQSTFDFLPPVAPGIERALRSPIAAKADPETSHLAAKELTASGRHEGQLMGVLALLKQHPRSTSLELARHSLLYDRYITARRLPQLEKVNLVRKVRVRTCHIGNRPATEWEAI